MSAATPAEFNQMLAAYRIWTGRRSYLKMSAAIQDHYAQSTLATIPNRVTLPTFELVTAYIQGCGGDPGDLAIWQAAWRRIALQSQRPPDPRPRD